MISFYGLPRGPTWPKAATLTNEFLNFVTKEFIIGFPGIVIIAGDFNFGPRELPCFETWRAYGYHSAQDLAYDRWSQPISPTCKGSTERDMLWLSPIAASLCSSVEVQDVFHDHASLSIQLDIEVLQSSISSWPRPRAIPWEQVQLQEWQASCEAAQIPDHVDPTKQLQVISDSFEKSLDGFVANHPRGSLSSAHCGRARRLMPAKITPSPRSCRASRPGEEHLIADTVSKVVIVWFKQLRRLQSYRHSICAGNFHDTAVQYRLELWSSIRRAGGFEHSFSDWWNKQDFAITLGELPIAPPGANWPS